MVDSNLSALLADPISRAVLLKHVRSFVFNALPADVQEKSPDANYFNVSVEWRGPGDRWAVMHRGSVLDRKLTLEYEPLPSSRSDEFKRDFRFGLDEAVVLAERYAASVKLGKMTVDDFTAWYYNRVAELKKEGYSSEDAENMA